jgi:hypothetical protein
MTAPHASQRTAALPPELASHPRYRFLRELGRGAMGVVYHAEQTLMDRQVAVKVLSPAVLGHADGLERFRREVRAAAKLSHPNIVLAYDAEQAGDLHMLVMEFVEGQTLADLLQRHGPLPVAQACQYARQTALGLQHAHECGMVHRDIKPSNLMLTREGQVKILDFGLAKLVRERGRPAVMTAQGAYMGTPAYSAPEQATDSSQADIRADIYSLGCTLYSLLAGGPPFQEESEVKTILAHLEKDPRPLPEVRAEVPAGLWAVLARMMAKDPARRFQTPAEVAQALAPFCKPRTRVSVPVARPAPPPPAPAARAPVRTESVSPAPPRGKKWWLAAVMGVVAGVTGVVLFLVAGAVVVGALLLARGNTRATAPQGVVLLDVDPPEAMVLVDGRPVTAPAPVGQEPLRLELPPGEHEVKVVMDGFEPYTRQVTLAADRPEHLTARLAPERPAERKPLEAQPPAVPQAVGEAPAGPTKSPAPSRPAPGEDGGGKVTGGGQPDAEMPPREPRRPGGGRRPPPKVRKEEAPPPDAAAEEAKRQAEAEARQKADAEARQKAEAEERQQDAARQLKQAKDLIDESKVERLKGNAARSEKLLERAGERFREVVDKYPGTRAAAEARDLLDKLGR